MTDITTATTDTTLATEQSAAPSVEAAAAAPHLAWLETASPDEIARNPRVAGILGSRLQNEREKIRREIHEEQSRAASQKAEQDLLTLAQQDPFTFAQTYLSKAEQERIGRETENLKASTRTEFTQQLGRSYQKLPELNDLTPAEKETLHRAIAGKPEGEFLESFNLAMVDIAAERRANAKVAKFRDAELSKEREAIRQEEAAKRLKGSARPTLTRSGAPPVGNGWQDLPPGKDFNAEYEKHVLGRRR